MGVEAIIVMNNPQLHRFFWVPTTASLPRWASHAKRSSRPISTSYLVVCSAVKGLCKRKRIEVTLWEMSIYFYSSQWVKTVAIPCPTGVLKKSQRLSWRALFNIKKRISCGTVFNPISWIYHETCTRSHVYSVRNYVFLFNSANQLCQIPQSLSTMAIYNICVSFLIIIRKWCSAFTLLKWHGIII